MPTIYSIFLNIFRWKSPLRAGPEINFFPYPPFLSKAYLDVIEVWDWNSFTVLYEDDEGLMRITKLVEDAKDLGILVDVKKLDSSITGHYRYRHILWYLNFVIFLFIYFFLWSDKINIILSEMIFLYEFFEINLKSSNSLFARLCNIVSIASQHLTNQCYNCFII